MKSLTLMKYADANGAAGGVKFAGALGREFGFAGRDGLRGGGLVMRREDIAEIDKIEALTRIFVQAVNPKKIYLFGSYARGDQNENSDYDFFLIVEEKKSQLEQMVAAQVAICRKQNRPVDIIVSSQEKFDVRKLKKFSLEYNVEKEGVLIYEQ